MSLVRAEIISIPESAVSGDFIPITARVTNLQSYPVYIEPYFNNYDCGGTVLSAFAFLEWTEERPLVMPNNDLVVKMTVWVWTASIPPYVDATDQRTVSLLAPSDIVNIDAPASAPAGEPVIVDVSVKNIGTSVQSIAVTGVFDSSSMSWQFDYLDVAPQETVIFRGNFIMPAKSVRVTVSSYHWDGSKMVKDDTGYVDIALSVVPTKPEFQAFAISEYNIA